MGIWIDWRRDELLALGGTRTTGRLVKGPGRNSPPRAPEPLAPFTPFALPDPFTPGDSGAASTFLAGGWCGAFPFDGASREPAAFSLGASGRIGGGVVFPLVCGEGTDECFSSAEALAGWGVFPIGRRGGTIGALLAARFSLREGGLNGYFLP